MSHAPTTLTLNGHPLGERHVSFSVQQNGNSSAPSSVVAPTDARSLVPGPSPSVVNPALLDDYLCAELSPTALTARHNISLEQLLDHFADEPPPPGPDGRGVLGGGFDQSAVPRSDFRVPRSGAASLLARLEAFSLRRARVIGALMRPQVLHQLFVAMTTAEVGTDTHRRAATTLLRAIDGPRLSPPTPAGEMVAAATREGSTRRGRRPPPPIPRHRMSEFLGDDASHASGYLEPQASRLKPHVASSRCPVCGSPWSSSTPLRDRDAHTTSTPPGCARNHVESLSGGFAPRSASTQPPATDAKPSGLPDARHQSELSEHGYPPAPENPCHEPQVSNRRPAVAGPKPQAKSNTSACPAPLRETSPPPPSVTGACPPRREFSPSSSDSKSNTNSSLCLCASVVKTPSDPRAPP